MSLETRIARARAKSATASLFQWPRKPSFMRECAATEQECKHGNLFTCVHGKSYFVPCTTCKRTERDAEAQLTFYKATLARVKKQLGL